MKGIGVAKKRPLVSKKYPTSPLPPLCPICKERRSLTDEDIVPIWVRKLVFVEMFQIAPENLPRKVKVRICVACNSRLSAVFESPASPILKPIIGGHTVALTPRQQVLIAGWLVKTDLLYMLYDGIIGASTNRDYWAHLLREMLETGLPPAGTSVRIGQTDHSAIEDWPQPLDHLLPEGLPSPSMYALASVGFLAWETIHINRGSVIGFATDTPDSDWLVRVWPPHITKRLDWPPIGVVSQSELHAVRLRWERQSQIGGNSDGLRMSATTVELELMRPPTRPARGTPPPS